MKKLNNNYNLISFLAVVLAICGFFITRDSFSKHPLLVSTKQAFAEEEREEEEEEHREEEDKEDDDREDREENENDYEAQQPVTTQQTIYETRTIYVPAEEVQVRYVTVVDPGFDVDSDKDGLVDAIDPDPTIHQKEFFTDDDKDGIANAFDTHPNDNDFDYVLFEDNNNNGIIDSIEQ